MKGENGQGELFLESESSSFKIIQTQDLLEISELLISIFDFIDFKEQLEGEKHVLKQKLCELASNHDLRIINIDNLEEFYFIFKNLYQSLKAQGKKNG